MLQMLMITVKYLLIIESFQNRWNLSIFQYYPIYLFNIANVSRWLSGVHWQQTLLICFVRKHPIVKVGEWWDTYMYEYM